MGKVIENNEKDSNQTAKMLVDMLKDTIVLEDYQFHDL